MASINFESVVLYAEIAEGFQRLGDVVETFRMEVEEALREMRSEDE